MEIEKYIDELDHFKEVYTTLKQLEPQEFKYKTDQCLKTFKLIFERFCPYQIEDKVVLIKTPEISREKSWGWLGAKHFLVEGATAEVYQRSYSVKRNMFTFGLKFNSDSYIHYQTKEVIYREPKEIDIFWFSEDYLAKYEE